MTELIISLLVLAHILADFYFQSDEIAKKKYNDIKTRLKHMMWHIGISFAVLLYFVNWNITVVIIAVGVLHCLIESAKPRLESLFENMKFDDRSNKICSFLIDQMAHLVSIIAFYPLISKHSDFNGLGSWINEMIESYWPILDITKKEFTFIVWFVVSVLVVLKAADIFISTCVFYKKNDTNDEIQERIQGHLKKKNGKFIGYLERLMILLFLISDTYQGLYAVFFVKSIARFKELGNDLDAEYYLIGTLTSYLVAIIAGAFLIFARAHLHLNMN